jgi:hypothetical protein
VTASAALVVAVSPPVSAAVALTVSVKVASLLAGGVMVRPAAAPAVRLHTPPPWSVPGAALRPWARR